MPILIVHMLIYIVIILVVTWIVVLLLQQIPGLPAVIATLVWAIGILICLAVLLNALAPGALKVGMIVAPALRLG